MVCATQTGKKYELLSAKYDGLNRLISLNIGPLWREFKCDGESEILTSWRPFELKERETVFAYRNGMIYAIARPTMPTGKPAFLYLFARTYKTIVILLIITLFLSRKSRVAGFGF